jgi:hypothetical protein
MIRVAIIVDNKVENIISIEEENLHMLAEVTYLISDVLEIGDIID